MSIRIYDPQADVWVKDRNGTLSFIADSQKATEWENVREAQLYLRQRRDEAGTGLEYQIETFQAVDLDRPYLDNDEHYVTVDNSGWAIQHALRCRPNLTMCDFHRAMIVDQFDLGEHVEDAERFAYRLSVLDSAMYRVELDDMHVVFKEKVQ